MSRSTLKSICRLLDAATKELPVEQQFVADLKRSIEMDDEKNMRKPSTYYKPSSLRCIRSMWYQRTAVEPSAPPAGYQLIGIGWSGTDTHVRVQEAILGMRNNNFDCEYVKVADYVKLRKLSHLEIVGQDGYETHLHDNELNLSFRCDGIIKYKGHYYILEIKSESSYKFSNRTGVAPEHYNQGIAYSVSLRITGVIFLYVNRDIFDFKAFMFIPSDSQKEDLVGLITECDVYVARKICPPKPETTDRHMCGYCIYKDRCASEL